MISVSLRTSLGRKLLHPRPFYEFADDACHILEWLSIPDREIMHCLASKTCQLHQPFSELNEFSSCWWMRDFTDRDSQYIFFPASHEDRPEEGDLFYELDILDSLKPFRIILRVGAQDTIRIVGAIIGPSDESHPTDATFRQKRAKALLVMKFMVRGGMQLCLRRRSNVDLSMHYSKATLLAAIVNDCQPSHRLWQWSTPPESNTQTAKASAFPQLCDCDLSPHNVARHQTLIELLNYHSSQAKKRLAIKHNIPISLSYQSNRSGRGGTSAMPQMRQSNLSMRLSNQKSEITGQSETDQEQFPYTVKGHFTDSDHEQQRPTSREPMITYQSRLVHEPSLRPPWDSLSHNF